MPLTNTEKGQRLRDKREALGLKEIRSIWATDEEEVVIKAWFKENIVKKRTDNKSP